jgi:hypothetical protein
MKWLQDNPLGVLLAATCGLFVLLALGMTIVWNLPASSGATVVETESDAAENVSLTARKMGTLGDYLVINEKPVFNESRTPVIEDVEGDGSEEDTAIAIKDAPEVRLTGVVITSNMKIASLTPADTNIETVMAHEGEALTGEFVGWQVAAVNPRAVILESRDGQSLELDLQVHDVKIKEPPAPVAPAKSALEKATPGSEAVAVDDDEPLSRAEQIRQRIAERREELRLEQEAQQADGGSQAAAAKPAPKRSAYQEAVRAMMQKKSKDSGSNDKQDK